MSVSNTDRIDATTLRNGWAILNIYQVEPWTPVDERTEELRAKIATYSGYVQSPRFLSSFYATPVRIELTSSDPVPQSIAALCEELGVIVFEGDSTPKL